MSSSRTFRFTLPRHRGVRPHALAAAAGTACLVLAGCTGGGQAAAAGGVAFDEAESATIQIEAVGTFEEPGEGAFEGAGRGSGFIVEPNGLAVTNNHVVVGAGTLKVWLDGEEYNAQVKGSSECLDLAVIDLEGDDHPFFDWYDGEIDSAQEVWAVGFPLGDPTFTITRGIVSKPDTEGDTPWASIDHTIEHDARIRPGNSGGPLIEEGGAVVGVNYAGDDVNDINLAIHRDEVLEVLTDLEKGIDVLSLGVNGRAIAAEDGSYSGIFASSVASGSVADEAGVRPGDLITRMEGVTLATDGTMADYCSVLRTHGTNATLALEVFRPSDGGVYVGQLNGDPLEVASLPEPEGGGGTGGTETTDLTVVKDEAGIVSVQVPASWSDTDPRSVTDERGNTIYDITASTSIQDFRAGWRVSGVTVSASQDGLDDYTVDQILDSYQNIAEGGGCTLLDGARQPYSDALYQGSYDYWQNCGGAGTTYVVIAAEAKDGDHLIWTSIQLAQGDEAVLEVIVNSFMADFP
jgi:serine protease Do